MRTFLRMLFPSRSAGVGRPLCEEADQRARGRVSEVKWSDGGRETCTGTGGGDYVEETGRCNKAEGEVD